MAIITFVLVDIDISHIFTDAIQPYGAIYICDYNNKGVNLWPGGLVEFSGQALYWPAELRMRTMPTSGGS